MAHIYHLHENLLLTFGEIKDIFKKVLKNELKVYEKTDGQNILLSYSIRRKQALSARTKSDITAGGLSARELSDRFRENENVRKTFHSAIREWEKAVALISTETLYQIFGEDANIFYNCEIQDPFNKNVINYDRKYIVIHPNGHKEIDKISKEDINRNYTNNIEILEKALREVESKYSGFDYKLVTKSIFDIKKLFDEKTLNLHINKINNLMQAFNVKDEDTIKTFCFKSIYSNLDEEFGGMTKFLKEEVARKICNTPTIQDFKVTLKSVPSSDKETIKRYVLNSDKIIKNTLEDLEEVIHDFSIDILSGLKSLYILDNDKEIKRIKQELKIAIEKIKSSKDSEAIAVLYQQLKKLRNVENVDTAVEGLVFDYGGNIYKLTGNFAPVNQILGLLTYGKVNFKNNIEYSKKENIVVYPGKFKPPHLGHFMCVKELAKNKQITKITVIISPKEQDGITAEMSKSIWEIFRNHEPKIEAIISKNNSPITDAYDYLKTVDNSSKVFFTLSEKELEKGDSRFKEIRKFVEKFNPGLSVETIYTEQNKDGIDGTYVRKLIIDGKKEMFFTTLPKELSTEEKENAWRILKGEPMFQEKDIEGAVKQSLNELLFRR